MRVLWFSFAILALDQVSKTLVHLYMVPGQSIAVIGDVFRFTYTTNPGMAFGFELGPKLFLSLFSIVATIALIGYLWMVRRAPMGYRVSLAVVIGGALGNVIDRTFYGLIYGHGPLFHGEVIDFIHIDLWRGFVEIPLLGTYFIPLFPIWNVADMGIVLGVVAVIVTQRSLQQTSVRSEGDPGHESVSPPPPELPGGHVNDNSTDLPDGAAVASRDATDRSS